jgi:hypothetical protein
MSDIYGKIESERGALEKLASKIPGYGGYMKKEERREADRLLREEVVRAYSAQLVRLNDVPVALLEAGQIALLDDVDRARTRLQTFIDRVRTASYGYAGLFAALKVDEAELAKLYSFDAGLLEGINGLTSAVDAVAAPETSAQAIKALIDTTDQLNATFLQREAVLHGTQQA